MKRTKNHLLLSATLLALTAFTGCLEYHVQTIVFPDGSSERTITIERDSKSLPQAAFPLPADSTWTIEWKEQNKDSGSTKYVFVAHKRFSDPEDLAREYAHTGDSATIAVRVIVEKRFRWFFTYFSYRETYGEFNQFSLVPASQVLTHSEINSLIQGQTNDSLKARLEEWQQRAVFEELWFGLMKGISHLGDKEQIEQVLRSKKEMLFDVTVKDTACLHPDGFLQMLKRQIGSPSINLLRPDVVAAFNRIDEKIDLGARAQGTYVNSVVLPGVLLDANSTDIRGTKVAWKFDSERLKLQEVVMSAESRVTNLWAFAVTAAVVVLTAIVLVLFMRRRT